MIISLSQKTSCISEELLLADPFGDTYPDMHGNIFIHNVSCSSINPDLD
jgi:hypothetical protein